MEFEHKHEKLLPRALFIKRVLKYSAFCTGFIIVSLGIGIAGYMYYCHLDFVSGLLNASMILTGMGPVDPMPNNPAKIFASLYAIFSGVAFLTTVAVFLAPFAHRLMHIFHLKEKDVD